MIKGTTYSEDGDGLDAKKLKAGSGKAAFEVIHKKLCLLMESLKAHPANDIMNQHIEETDPVFLEIKST